MTITTTRLQIRPLQDIDVGPLSVFFEDDRITAHLALENMNTTAARLFASEFVYSSQTEFQRDKTGVMALLGRNEENLLGYAGLRPFV